MTTYLVYYLLPLTTDQLKFECSAESEYAAIEACVLELHSIFGYNIDVRSLITSVEPYNKYFL